MLLNFKKVIIKRIFFIKIFNKIENKQYGDNTYKGVNAKWRDERVWIQIIDDCRDH